MSTQNEEKMNIGINCLASDLIINEFDFHSKLFHSCVARLISIKMRMSDRLVFLSAVEVVKLITEEIQISPILRYSKKFVLMSEPALKSENNCANLKQIYTLKLFIAFNMAYYCCFSLGGNQDFPEFLQKKFYNISYCPQIILF